MNLRTERPQFYSWIITVAALALVAVVGVILFVTGPDTTYEAGDSHTKGRTCVRVGEPHHGVSGSANAPDGGHLHVIDQGFTQLGPGEDTGSNINITLGAIIENTSKQVAYHTRIFFNYFDQYGRSALPSKAQSPSVLIPVILPGQRIPVGFSTEVFTLWPQDGGFHFSTVSTMAVNIGSVTWMSNNAMFAELSTAIDDVTKGPRGGGWDSYVVSYRVNFGYCRELTYRGTSIVFRNTAGAIIGGRVDNYAWDVPHYSCNPKTSTLDIGASFSPSAKFAPAKTEIYPLCDLAPYGRDPHAIRGPNIVMSVP